MIAINRIWEELKQTKSNIICIQRYTDKRRSWLRWHNGLIIFFSAGGALTSLINHWFAVGAVTIITIISLIKSVLPTFVQSEQEIIELDHLMDFYSKYLNSLEQLWYNFFHEYITEEEMMKQLFLLKEQECDKYSILNKGIRAISQKDQEEIDRQCTEYTNRVYFQKQ
jgi:hypothetical protein